MALLVDVIERRRNVALIRIISRVWRRVKIDLTDDIINFLGGEKVYS